MLELPGQLWGVSSDSDPLRAHNSFSEGEEKFDKFHFYVSLWSSQHDVKYMIISSSHFHWSSSKLASAAHDMFATKKNDYDVNSYFLHSWRNFKLNYANWKIGDISSTVIVHRMNGRKEDESFFFHARAARFAIKKFDQKKWWRLKSSLKFAISLFLS